MNVRGTDDAIGDGLAVPFDSNYMDARMNDCVVRWAKFILLFSFFGFLNAKWCLTCAKTLSFMQAKKLTQTRALVRLLLIFDKQKQQ